MSHRSSRLGRRAFISASGAAVIGLPLFEAFAPKMARAANGTPRFIGFYVANGKHMPAWKPTMDGADYALTPTLTPLAALKKKVLVLTGLENEGAARRVGGDHARGTGSFFTCTNIHTASEISSGSPPNGISVDQVMADEIGASSRIASLQLGLTNQGRDQGYGSEFIQNISFDRKGKFKPKTVQVASAFDTLFQGFDPTASAADVERRRRLKASVLDFAVGQAKALSPTISRSDNIKLDQYLTSVRELEQRLQNDSGSSTAACAGATKPSNPMAVPDQVKAMLDVMVLGLQCNATRVITYMLGNGGDGAISGFPWLDISDHHHAIAHHQNQQTNFDKLTKVNLWEVEQLAYLLGKLDAIDEGGATLLDNTLVLYSSEISDGNRHNHDDLPVLLAGGSNLGVSSGQHLRFDKKPIASLFLSLIHAMGATSVIKFGDDGTAPLPGVMT
jgi:Protein of unknown function (DUF1552)